jgi:hypothetical protein
MALKQLLTNLESALQDYPMHQKYDDGGTPSGKSDSIFDHKQFRQKSFKFGEGTAYDRQGADYSKEPYLYSGALSADQLPDVPNPSDKGVLSKVGDFVDSATDGLIRGGLLTAIKRSAQDLVRIGKWAFDGPGGPAWLLTQTGLQRSNPKIQEKGATILGINLGGNSRTYNPLGINTLAQTLVNFAGLHINRGGALPLGPTNYRLETGYGYDKTNDRKYEFKVRSNADVDTVDVFENRPVALYYGLIEKENKEGHADPVLYDYSGGPHSIYGIGKTTLKRFDRTAGEFDHHGFRLLWERKHFNERSHNNKARTSYADEPNDGYIKSDGITQQGRAEYNRWIWRATAKDWLEHFENNAKGYNSKAYKASTYKISDFRKNRGVPYTNYHKTVKGADNKSFRREERVNMGTPGDNRTRLMKTNAYVAGGVTIDKINALDILRTKGDFDSHAVRDLIRFRIEAIDTDNPAYQDTMIFRAFLDSFNDSYNGNWNEFVYNGRGEPFYTYNNFNRNLTFSFKIAAQSRWEMMPLYRKLNFLVSNTAPDYKSTRMRGPFMKLTIGSMIDRVPGFFSSIQLSWKTDYPWEITIDSPELGGAKDLLVLPHVLDVSCNYTPVHNFIPQKSITKSPFILSHESNRYLQDEKKWYKFGATPMIEEEEKGGDDASNSKSDDDFVGPASTGIETQKGFQWEPGFTGPGGGELT